MLLKSACVLSGKHNEDVHLQGPRDIQIYRYCKVQSSRCTIPIYVHCTRCSRVSQGHAILLIQGTWHGAQCMQQGIIGACRVISWLSWGRRCHTHQHPSNQFAMFFLWLYNIFDTFLHILKVAVTFLRQHICTKAQANLHKTYCEKAQHKL